MNKHSQITTFAKQLAQHASKKIAQRIDNLPKSSLKPDRSVLTKLDHQLESDLRTKIIQKFPDHSIHGEEHDNVKGDSNFTWHLDPIDGTTNLTMSVPLFSTMIAVTHNDQVITSAVSFPSTNSLIWAKQGRGSFKNESPIKPPTSPQLQDCTFLVDAGGGGKNLGWRLITQNFSNIVSVARSIRYLGAASTSTLPLTGVQPFVFITFDASPHDLIPISLIHQQAGRSVTTLNGKPWTINDRGLISVQPSHKSELISHLKSE